MTVRTRFAPSPTGYLHIGGVRTALFNWLFARQHGGKFILRIDDTDAGRNQPEALQPILDGFRWLGLDWDEGAEVGGPYGPYYQSQRLDRYREAVQQLLDRGLAYWDYATNEETKAEMELAEKEKRPKIYSRKWMADSEKDRARFEAEGRKGTVKVKMPRIGYCTFSDHVRGHIEVPWGNEQDIVIQRSDGSITYNLANVVDDYDMRITHVIRAEEHLSNTPRQIYMLEGLGYPRPQYAHVPFVAEPGSKNKLSKRKISQYLKNQDFKKVYDHATAITNRIGLTTTPETFNPVLVEFYREVGYFPDVLLNYLVLLGWSYDDKRESFGIAEMIEHFSLERVNPAPASLDVKKLFAFQERAMQSLSVSDRVIKVYPFVEKAGLATTPNAQKPMLARIIEGIGPRLTVGGDILDYEYMFMTSDDVGFSPNLALDFLNQAFKKHDPKPTLSDYLLRIRTTLSEVEEFNAADLRQHIEDLCRSDNVKPGPISQILRLLVTGREVGFGTYETVEILGKQLSLARIDKALSAVVD